MCHKDWTMARQVPQAGGRSGRGLLGCQADGEDVVQQLTGQQPRPPVAGEETQVRQQHRAGSAPDLMLPAVGSSRLSYITSVPMVSDQ
jgi:hypothetical protein